MERELRRLSVVAFAMFNRASQWVSRTDLEQDLQALLGEPPVAVGSTDLRAPMRSADLVLGRFFFIYRTQAVRDGAVLSTYEFLHSTFGEYLVARLTFQVLKETAARALAAALPPTMADDALPRTPLSFAALVARAPIVKFLVDLAEDLDDGDRRNLRDLLVRLFRTAAHSSETTVPGYRPRASQTAERAATYTANLILLMVVADGPLDFSEVCPDGHTDVGYGWTAQALLWHGQLTPDERINLVNTLTVERTWTADRRPDIRITLNDGVFQPPPLDPAWSFLRQRITPPPDGIPGGHTWAYARRRANFQNVSTDDAHLHALEPLLDSILGPTVRTFRRVAGERYVSAAHALLDVWLLPLQQPTAEHRRQVYETCIRTAVTDTQAWEASARPAFIQTLLRLIAADYQLPASVALDLLITLIATPMDPNSVDPRELARCVLSVFQRSDLDSPGRLRKFVEDSLTPSCLPLDDVTLDEAIHHCLHQMGQPNSLWPTVARANRSCSVIGVPPVNAPGRRRPVATLETASGPLASEFQLLTVTGRLGHRRTRSRAPNRRAHMDPTSVHSGHENGPDPTRNASSGP